MTDNIGKHLFCPVWGAGYSGVIVAETAKTWLIKLPYRKREDRKRKTPGDILAPVGTDWKAACDAFDAAMRAYRDEITDAKTVLSHAQAKQKAAAIAALTGDETSLAIDASVKLEQDGGHL